MTPAAGRTRLARVVSFGALLSLLVLGVTWHTWLARPPVSFWPLLVALFVLPLLVPLKGMAGGRPQSYITASLISLLYFCHGVMEAFGAPAERWLALVEVALSLLLFVATLAFARLRRRELARAAGSATG